MTIRPGAGSTFAIATTGGNPDYGTPANQTAYEALTYTAVGETESIGGVGDEAGTTEFTALGDRRVRKIKTVFDAGTIQISCANDPADAGQDAMEVAIASDFDVPFRIQWNDEVTIGGTPTTHYFYGLVTSVRAGDTTVDGVQMINYTVAINSAITTAEAT